MKDIVSISMRLRVCIILEISWTRKKYEKKRSQEATVTHIT